MAEDTTRKAVAVAVPPATENKPAVSPNQSPYNRSNQGGGQGGRGGGFGQRGGFGGGGRPYPRRDDRSAVESEYFEKVVQVNRVSKKTKGGDKRSLSVLVVAGDRKGKVGVGLGKAADVQSAVRKATSYAKRHLIEIPLKDGRTIPHDIFVKLGAAKVLLKPAPEGTGVIAGGAVRVVVEAAGVKDIVSKTLGTSNQASNVYATLKALSSLKPIGLDTKASAPEADKKEVTKEDKKGKK